MPHLQRPPVPPQVAPIQVQQAALAISRRLVQLQHGGVTVGLGAAGKQRHRGLRGGGERGCVCSCARVCARARVCVCACQGKAGRSGACTQAWL